MEFKVGYAEAQVEVCCRLPSGTSLQELAEAPIVQETVAFLKKTLGLEHEVWDSHFLPQLSSSIKARQWCGFGGSTIVFSPRETSRRVFVEAALYRKLPRRARAEAMSRNSTSSWKDIVAHYRSVVERMKGKGKEEDEELSFWVMYSEAEEPVTVALDTGCSMRDAYKLPEAVKATKKLLRRLKLGEEHAEELRMRFVPELKPLNGGGQPPFAAQWSRFKGATLLFCEDPEVGNLRQDGALYKQAQLYRCFLRLSNNNKNKNMT